MSRKKEVLVRFDAEQLDALRVKAAEWGQTPEARRYRAKQGGAGCESACERWLETRWLGRE